MEFKVYRPADSTTRCRVSFVQENNTLSAKVLDMDEKWRDFGCLITKNGDHPFESRSILSVGAPSLWKRDFYLRGMFRRQDKYTISKIYENAKSAFSDMITYMIMLGQLNKDIPKKDSKDLVIKIGDHDTSRITVIIELNPVATIKESSQKYVVSIKVDNITKFDEKGLCKKIKINDTDFFSTYIRTDKHHKLNRYGLGIDIWEPQNGYASEIFDNQQDALKTIIYLIRIINEINNCKRKKQPFIQLEVI